MSRDALIVGISSYRYLNPLKAPAEDAEAIAQRLQLDGEFKVQRMPEYIDQADDNKPAVSLTQTVSQLQLEQALKQLFRPASTQAPETAIFYFSGHGIPDKDGFDKGYLATSDTNPNKPRSGLSLRWLQWLLSESEVKQQIIWLDCCHSGSLIVNIEAANPGNSKSRDRCFIASSRDFENSWEDINSPYSVLTKALLEGLNPARLPGRWIDTFSLVDYVNQVLKGEFQTPICNTFGEAINLTRLWKQQSIKIETSDINSVCPYKGLSYFEDNNYDYQYFYGRRALTDELLDAVRTSNFIAIVGASGSGKSSILRAGLLHQLRQRRITGSNYWDIHVTVPGDNPCQSLAAMFVDASANHLERTAELAEAETLIQEGPDGLRRLVQTAKSERVILVIDQFEEVFTLCQSDVDRQHFFEVILTALETAPNKLCVILAMRADFVGRCFERHYHGLADYIRNNLVPVKPMIRTELMQAIELPAKKVGLTIEQELIQSLVDDVERSPGSLPLLQYALKALWDLRKRNTLQLKTYTQLGRVSGTLQQRADEIYQSLTEEEKRVAKHIFLNLTQFGEGSEDTRRRVNKDSLVTAQHPAELIDIVVKRLTDSNLIVTNELIEKDSNNRKAVVDVAHEALIRNWPRLRRWLEENRILLKQQRNIEIAAEKWRKKGLASDYFLQGRQLIDAKSFQEEHEQDLPLSNIGELFVLLSVAHRNNNRIKTLGMGIVIPLFLAIYIGGQIAMYYTKQQSLRRAGLSRTNLNGAYLFSANLSDANLSEANLSETNLSKANLQNANLRHANLHSANLSGANLQGANLRGANFRKVNLSEANLKNAILNLTNLSEVNLSKSNLARTLLREVDLEKADLTKRMF